MNIHFDRIIGGLIIQVMRLAHQPKHYYSLQ
ncbi:hypothetical protein FHS14_002254 [Paenibacillus baekrokdamisoli]|nr:hypothetical protein [Paenibacillus baekrokdamisoli]